MLKSFETSGTDSGEDAERLCVPQQLFAPVLPGKLQAMKSKPRPSNGLEAPGHFLKMGLSPPVLLSPRAETYSGKCRGFELLC